MCGICGLFGNKINHSNIAKMVYKLEHRGPEKSTIFKSNIYSAGVTRLFFTDKEAPNPFSDEKTTISLNGEIYNYKELKSLLSKKHTIEWRYDSDTEVLFQGIRTLGIDFLNLIEGMFAVAVFRNNELILARDEYGIKPLYYSVDNSQNSIVYASELKSLLSNSKLSSRLNIKSVIEKSIFNFTLGRNTFLEDIHQVLPGEVITFTCGNGKIHITHNKVIPKNKFEDESLKNNEPYLNFKELLNQSVENVAMGLDNIGVQLSGGVDSSVLTGIINRISSKKILTFTVYDNPKSEDLIYARRVSKYFNTDHHEIKVKELNQFDLVKSVYVNEMPIGITSNHISSGYIRKFTKAIISGDGADEMFWGYKLYSFPDQIINRYKRIISQLYNNDNIPKNILQSSKNQIDFLSSGINLENRREKLYNFFVEDQLYNNQLMLADKGSMINNLEIRLPFLNITQLSGFNKKIVDNNFPNKSYIKKYINELIPNELGQSISNRRKMSANESTRLSNLIIGQKLERLNLNYFKGHILENIFMNPVNIFTLDIFIYIFILNQGELNEDFEINSFYARNKNKLKEIYANLFNI